MLCILVKGLGLSELENMYERGRGSIFVLNKKYMRAAFNGACLDVGILRAEVGWGNHNCRFDHAIDTGRWNSSRTSDVQHCGLILWSRTTFVQIRPTL